jgi:signal transduction histidine kinase
VGASGAVEFANDAGRRILNSGAAGFWSDPGAPREHFHEKLNQWFEVQSYPNPDGGHTVLIRNITASRRLQEALRASEEDLAHDLAERKQNEHRIQGLAEASRILESSLDYEATFEELTDFLANHICDACVALIREEDQILRISARDPGIALAQPDYSDAIARTFTEGVAELRNTSLGSCAFIPATSGSTVGAVLLLIRGTEREFSRADCMLFEEIGRRAGLTLQHARLYRSAQEINRLKDEFVAIVSHELRTPLTPILGAVYMLRSEPNDPSIFKRALDLIERNAKAQSRLIQDLLDVSRIISGKLRLNMDTVDLPTVIHAAVDTVRPATDAKNIQLNVASIELEGLIYGDADRLQQVVWNLLANSVKFTPHGGTISIELEEGASHAELRVHDTGIGIDAEFLPHVFDRFRQADASRTRAHGGLGLGLAIVRHLVESHGGTVHAESSGDRQGATFTVKLPTKRVAEEYKAAQAGTAPHSA